MEFYKRAIEIVDVNLIYCLIPIILTLILVELTFKSRFETKKVLNLIRWTIIVYTILAIIGMALDPQESTFINRATGPYKIAYWITLLSIFVFGAESIRGLIFALMVGVVVGTYSSLFIATPVMFDTVKKKGIDLTDKNKVEEEEA